MIIRNKLKWRTKYMAHNPIHTYECHGFIEHYLFIQYLLNNFKRFCLIVYIS